MLNEDLEYPLTPTAPDRSPTSSTFQAEKFNRDNFCVAFGSERKNKESNVHME